MRNHRSLQPRIVLVALLTSTLLSGVSATALAQSSVIYEVPNETRDFMPICFDFMPDERYLLLAGAGGRGLDLAEIRVWDLETSQFILENQLDYEGQIYTIDVAPDGETLLVATNRHDRSLENDDVWLWKMQAWPQREGSPQLRSTVEPINRLQTATNYPDPPNVWSLIEGRAVLSKDASRVAVRRWDEYPPHHVDSIVILNTSGRVTETWNLPQGVGYSDLSGGTQFSPSGGRLAATQYRHHPEPGGLISRDTISVELSVWDADSGELIENRTVVDHESRLNWETHAWRGLHNSLDYSSDGGLIACDGPGFAIEIVNADTLETVRSLAGLDSCVQSVAFSPDDSLVAAVSNDMDRGDLCLWNARTGELLFRNENPEIDPEMTHLMFSPDGTRIITRGYYLERDNTRTEIRVWDVEQMRNPTPE